MSPNFEERIKAVEPERFLFALGVYQAAAAIKGPYVNPSEFSFSLVEKDGSAIKIQFTDIPENRGMLAVKKEFPDANEFQNLSFRIMTFSEVLRDRKLIKMGLVRHGEGGDIEIHDAVINALAMAPFRKSGALNKPAFHAIVKAEYTKLETDENG
jgi:hypothetical protein